MSVLVAILSVFGTAGAIMLLGTQDLGIGTGVKLAILTPLILLAVYCLARIPRKEDKESAYSSEPTTVRFFERDGARCRANERMMG